MKTIIIEYQQRVFQTCQATIEVDDNVNINDLNDLRDNIIENGIQHYEVGFEEIDEDLIDMVVMEELEVQNDN